MSITELGVFLSNAGWIKDRWGHWHKGEYRIKVQRTSVRLERKYTDLMYATTRYVRIRGAYLSRLSIVNGKLVGLTV